LLWPALPAWPTTELIARHAGVADDDVEPAVALHRGVDEQLRRRLVGHVTGDRRHLGSRGAQLVGRALELGGVARADDQRAAVAGELAGQQQAESAGRAGDHRHLAVEIVLGAAGGQDRPRENACRDQRNRNFHARPASPAPRRETRPAGKPEFPRDPRWIAVPGGQGHELA